MCLDHCGQSANLWEDELGEDNTTPEMSLKGTKGFWMSPLSESVVRSQGWGWHPGHSSQPGSRTLQNASCGKPFSASFLIFVLRVSCQARMPRAWKCCLQDVCLVHPRAARSLCLLSRRKGGGLGCRGSMNPSKGGTHPVCEGVHRQHAPQ